MKRFLLLFSLLAAGTLALAKDNPACPPGGCQVQIRHLTVQPPCAADFSFPGFPAPQPSNVGCVRVTAGVSPAGWASLSFEGSNADHCYFFYTDPNATETNGFVTVVFTGVDGLVTVTNAEVPIFADNDNKVIVNVNCRGLASNNEQNITTVTQATIFTRL